MNRLGPSILNEIPILSVDEVIERIDAVTLDDLRALASELWPPEQLAVAGVGSDEDAFHAALAPLGGPSHEDSEAGASPSPAGAPARSAEPALEGAGE